MMRSTYEKPQHKNPHRLTVNQHVFPLMSIARFADSSGRVCICDMSRKKVRRAKPDDPMFVARRAWDHRAEVGYMKRIEDAFQELAAKIIAGTVSDIGNAEKAILKDFCALWYARARHRNLPRQEIQAKGFTGGGNLTLDQEEMAEKNGYTLYAKGWTLASATTQWHAHPVVDLPSI